MIVDAQVHLWVNDPVVVAATSGPFAVTHREMDADALIAQMDAAQVDRAVLVPLVEDYALEAAAVARYPDRLGHVARIALDRPQQTSELLALKERPGVMGLRQTFVRSPDRAWLTDGTSDWLWRAAAESGLPVMVLAPGQLPALGTIAARHPDLQMVIDHFGLGPDVVDDQVGPALEELWPLSELPNVAVKATTLPNRVSKPSLYASTAGHLRRTVDTFGADRVFWGTDFTRLSCSYQEAAELFTVHAGLSDEEIPQVMGDALLNWLGWH